MKAAQQPRFPDTCFCGSKNSLSRSLPTDLQILLAYRIHSLWYSFSSQNLHISHPLQGDSTNLGGLEKIEAFSCYLCWFLACSRFTDSGGRWTRRSADRGIGVADRPSQALLFFFRWFTYALHCRCYRAPLANWTTGTGYWVWKEQSCRPLQEGLGEGVIASHSWEFWRIHIATRSIKLKPRGSAFQAFFFYNNVLLIVAEISDLG